VTVHKVNAGLRLWAVIDEAWPMAESPELRGFVDIVNQ
jgi:hypothetical protein